MAGVSIKKMTGRERRKIRVRKKVFGTAMKPRLSVFRSTKHIYAQLIDDEKGVTLVAASTVDKEIREKLEGKKNERAKVVGEALAARAKNKDLANIVFDRNGYRYHGRVKAVAEGAREGGLNF